jgi:hypothetical protein
MKRLKGTITTKDGADIPLDAERIVLELDHGRTISIQREDVSGADGLSLGCGIDRPSQIANGRFVVRVPNFGWMLLTVEQAK